MSESAGELTVVVQGRDVGLSTLLTQLERLGKQADTTISAAGQHLGQALSEGAVHGATGVRTLTEEEAKAILIAQRLATEQQRTAQGAQRVATEQQRTVAATTAAARAEQQLARDTANTAAAQDRAALAAVRLAQAQERQTRGGGSGGGGASGKDVFQAVAGAVGGPLGGVLAATSPAGAIGAAAGAIVQATGAAITLGTQVTKVDRSFQGLAQTAGTTGQTLLTALRSGAKGEIDDLNLKLTANRANLLGVAKSADDFAKLFAIARARSVALGTDTQKAFDDLVTGLGRGSPLILDNLGIMVKLGEANEEYAKSLGKTVSQMTAAEQKQALINAVLKTANDIPPPPVDTYAALAATFENIKQAASASVSGGLEPAATAIERIGRAALGSRDAMAELRASLLKPGQAVTPEDVAKSRELFARNSVTPQADAGFRLTENQHASEGGIFGGSEAFDKVKAQYAAVREEAIKLSAINDQTAASVKRVTDEYAKTGDLDRYQGQLQLIAAAQRVATGEATTAVPAYIQQRVSQQQAALAAQQQADAQREQAQATAESSAQSAIDEVNSQTLAVSKQHLAEQAQAAAQAVLSGGGNIEATAARLAASSSLVDQLTAAYLRLASAQAATAAGPTLKQQERQFEGVGGGRRAPQSQQEARDNYVRDMQSGAAAAQAQRAQQERLTAAQREYNEAVGGTKTKIADLRSDLASLKPGTEAYIRTQTELVRAQQSGARGGKGKASEAEKDQKALLKAQDDYQTKSQDSAEQYEEEMGKIAEEGARKRAQAEREYQQASLDSRVGFYTQLANVKDPKLAKQMSADYEAAVAKASEIGRTKGADAGQAYLQASQQAIQNQSQLKGDIAQAEKDKDKPKAEYLRGLLKLQQDADNNRLKQVEDAGSAIATAEEKQYSEAQLRYAKHLDTLGETYQKKVKDIPGLGASLGGTNAGTGGTIPPPPPSASPAASTSATAGAGAASGSATLVTDPATQAAIDQLAGRLEGKLGDVVTAVGAVEKRVGDVERAIGKGRSALAP